MDVFIRNFIAKYSRIIKKHSSESLLKLLSALEYTEAILEITAAKLFGEKFKWLIIFMTHLIKCIIRLQLLVVHKFGIQSLPSLFTLKNFINDSDSTKKETAQIISQSIINKSTFKLKHTGRIVRSVKDSPANIEDRDWIVPSDEPTGKYIPNNGQSNDKIEEHYDPTQDRQQYIAEVLHIIRPLCHLTSMFVFDTSSWKQFMVPLSIDTLSLFLMNGTSKLSQSQKSEMRRRTILFLHYFIRSPLYEVYSSSALTILLSQIEQRIAGSKYLIKPLKGYIPQWRAVYNYCWTS